MTHKLESRLPGEISTTSDRQMIALSWQKMKITASGPSLHGKEKEEKMDTMTGFIFLVSKIAADSDCSHEIKRCLLIGRKL